MKADVVIDFIPELLQLCKKYRVIIESDNELWLKDCMHESGFEDLKLKLMVKTNWAAVRKEST
jgi:hypothetical protein